MRHAAKPASVFAAEIAGKCLGKGIADGVWMARAFAFDDFDFVGSI